MAHAVALTLVGLGTAVIVAASVGALRAGTSELVRVHYLTPITSLGAPLVGAGVCVAEGWGLTSGGVILIVGLLFVTGPVLGAATGRLIARDEGVLTTGGPE